MNSCTLSMLMERSQEPLFCGGAQVRLVRFALWMVLLLMVRMASAQAGSIPPKRPQGWLIRFWKSGVITVEHAGFVYTAKCFQSDFVDLRKGRERHGLITREKFEESPFPGAFVVKKGSKRCPRTSGVIPQPLSPTVSDTCSPGVRPMCREA